MAYDHIKEPDFSICFRDYYIGNEVEWDILLTTLSYLFCISEIFHPYDERIEDRLYWMNHGGKQLHDESWADEMGVIVILDDRLQSHIYSTKTIDSDRQLVEGYADVTYFDRGILITWSDDYGHPDLVEVLYEILVRCKTNAVAI